MPVDKNTFLTIQFIDDQIRNKFPVVEATAVMYDNHLIWSGVEQEAMFLLYTLEQEEMKSFYTYMAMNDDSSAKKEGDESEVV